jgi:hypothetical protein
MDVRRPPPVLDFPFRPLSSPVRCRNGRTDARKKKSASLARKRLSYSEFAGASAVVDVMGLTLQPQEEEDARLRSSMK